MKVTTIDGGFRGLRGGRGLGVASVTAIMQASAIFEASLRRWNSARSRFRAAVASGVIPQSDAAALEGAVRQLDEIIAEHVDRGLSAVEDDVDLAVWEMRGQEIAASANALAARIGLILGDEDSVRAWKIGFGITGAVATVGLLAWWFTRS